MQEEQMAQLLKTAIEDTFSATLSTVPDTYYFDNFNELEEECVISSIGFTGTLEGSCAICLPDSSACRLISRMTGQEITEITADIIDGVGEIVNIVLGSIKMKIKTDNFDFEIGVPSYIKGSRMVILSDIKKTVTLNRSYKLDDIIFAISLMYKMRKKEDDPILRKKLALEKLMRLKK